MDVKARFAAVVSLGLGLDSDKADLILRMWDESGLLDDPEWDNVPLHCLLVALVTKTIGKLVLIPWHQIQIAVVAGLLHDIRKQSERKRANEIIAETSVEKSAAFTQAAEEQAGRMSEFGDKFAEEIRVSGLSGHTSLQYFMSGDRPLHEKVFHIADDLCGDKDIGVRRGDVVVMLETRIAQLSVYYDWMVAERPDWLGGKNWVEALQEVGVNILDELAGLSRLGSGEDLNRALIDLVKVGD